MTKAEKRKARKMARKQSNPLIGDLAVNDGEEFSESSKGYKARDQWAKRYDNLNGAPESPEDY